MAGINIVTGRVAIDENIENILIETEYTETSSGVIIMLIRNLSTLVLAVLTMVCSIIAKASGSICLNTVLSKYFGMSFAWNLITQ